MIILLGMGVFQTWLLYKLFGELITFKESKWIKRFAQVGLYLTCLMPMQGGDLENAYFIFLIYMGIGLISSREDIIKRIGSTVLFYTMTLAIKMIAVRMEWMIIKQSYEGSIDELLEVLLCTIGFYIVYKLFRKIFGVTKEILSTRIWILLTLISLAVVGMVLMSMVVVSARASLVANLSVVLLMSICLMSIIAIFFIIEQIVKGTREESHRKKLEWELEYYNDLKVSQDETKKLLHDMKNHMGAVHAMLYAEQVEEATQYLKQVSGKLHEQASKVYCGHHVANALLNNKVKKMKTYHIAYEIETDLPSDLSVTPMEIGSILANTIDNAIEACMKIEDEKKRSIQIKARYMNERFIYEITNTKANEVVKKDKRFVTSKKDKSNHGYGLRQVEDIVSKYKGIVNVEYEEKTFTIMIVI